MTTLAVVARGRAATLGPPDFGDRPPGLLKRVAIEERRLQRALVADGLVPESAALGG